MHRSLISPILKWSGLERLRLTVDIKLRCDPALAVLDDPQKAKFAAFETAV